MRIQKKWTRRRIYRRRVHKTPAIGRSGGRSNQKESLRLTRLFLVQIGADVDRIGRINRTAAFLNVLNLALLVYDEGGAACKLSFLVEDSVGLCDLALHIAQEWEFNSDFLGEGGVRGRSVNADAKNRGVV
jgi:hypothetical protein